MICSCSKSTARFLQLVLVLAIFLSSAVPLYAAQVTLAWNAVSQAEGYRIYRRLQGATYDYGSPAWSGAGTTCTVGNLADNTTYYFVARAYAGSTQSSNSNEVSFKIAPAVEYTISAAAGANGSILPSGSISVAQGGSQSFTITPAAGYTITDVKIDGVSMGSLSSYTFSQVSANHTIQAYFGTNKYTITATAGTNGSIQPSGSVSVAGNGSQSFTIAPVVGYGIADVKVDGVSKGPVPSYVFSQVTANHTISATFAVVSPTYTIAATAGSGGTISPSGTVAVSGGGSQYFAIAAQSGYRTADVRVDGTSIGAAASFTFTKISSNHTISAMFENADSPSSIIIDDGDAGTIKGGSWYSSGGTGSYGTGSLYSKQVGADYSYEASVNGLYALSLWWSGYSSRCSNVPIEIYNNDALLDTIFVNQQKQGGQWNALGSYSFSGKARVVVVSENSGCSTCADAVRLNAQGPKIIDDGDQGTTAEGKWSLSSGTDAYGTGSLFSKSVGAKYTYSSGLAGTLDVALWWSNYSSRCADVPVKIYDGNVLLTTAHVDQTRQGGQWNSLGAYSFSGNASVVVLSESNSCSTSADAVKFSYNAARTIIDDGAAGTSSTGSWPISGGTGSFGAQSLYSKQAGAEYTYEMPITGSHDVSLWWSGYNSRCTSVPVKIYDGDALLETITIDQSLGSGRWNVLGRYDFSSKAKVVVVSTSSKCSTCADAVSLSD